MTNSPAGLALCMKTAASQTPASDMECSQSGRMDPGGFPRVCRKGVEGAGREQRGHHTANPRRCGKLPETPAQTVERAWVTPRVTISRKSGWNSCRQLCTSVPLMGTKPECLGVGVRWALRFDLYRQPRSLKLR